MTRRILVFDSGLGGLTVLQALRHELAGAQFIYCADNAGFPYGDWAEDDLVARIVGLIEGWDGDNAPDAVVIACNTASTLVLPALRARLDIPVVGTVPAIKPAAERTKTGMISVLATPGTVRRDYTRDLIDSFAGDVHTRLVGSDRLADMAEGELVGKRASDDEIREQITPCFHRQAGLRTDIVVLACTHYPLLVDRFRQVAPWQVEWLDPAPAIARRVRQVSDESSQGQTGHSGRVDGDIALTTAIPTQNRQLAQVFARFGLTYQHP